MELRSNIRFKKHHKPSFVEKFYEVSVKDGKPRDVAEVEYVGTGKVKTELVVPHFLRTYVNDVMCECFSAVISVGKRSVQPLLFKTQKCGKKPN